RGRPVSRAGGAAKEARAVPLSAPPLPIGVGSRPGCQVRAASPRCQVPRGQAHGAALRPRRGPVLRHLCRPPGTRRLFGRRGARRGVARRRAPAGSVGRLCPGVRPRARQPNFFLSWPLPVEQFGQLAYATVESVLFHHPGANVVLLSAGLPRTLFDVYLREGYCVLSLPVGPREAQGLAAAAAPESPGLGSLQERAALLGGALGWPGKGVEAGCARAVNKLRREVFD
ncbi:unnamed protein product, partial [Prorocentrum cordatum]